jgi:hypothetical protein
MPLKSSADRVVTRTSAWRLKDVQGQEFSDSAESRCIWIAKAWPSSSADFFPARGWATSPSHL